MGTDPGKRRWYQALTMDRAVQTGKPLAEVVNAPDYYPGEDHRRTAATGQGGPDADRTRRRQPSQLRHRQREL